SKPSRRSLENGKLFGSAQTLSCRCGRGCASLPDARSSRPSTRATPTPHLAVFSCPPPLPFLPPSCCSRQRKDIEHAPLRRVVRQIGHGIHKPQGRCAVPGIEIAGNNGARPPPNTSQHGHVLLTVRATIGNGLPDNA